MTEDGEPIREYLDRLRLSLRIPEVGRILVEAEDHLRAATADGVAAGLTEQEAQRAAIGRFGPVSAIVYAHQARHGRVAAMLADLGGAMWRVAGYLLLAIFVVGGLQELSQHPAPTPDDDLSWAVPGSCGVVLLAAFYLVRHVRRGSGRVWSVPLGGFFPLAAAGAAGLVAAVCVVLLSTHVATDKAGLAVSVLGYLCLGLVITYGARMVRMLRDQAREPGELA
jgi:hypothetical protein